MVRNTRRGFSLAEIMVALAVMAGLGMSLMTLVSGGAQVGARAGEMQMASMVCSRVIDRMVAVGYQGLNRKMMRSGPAGQLDLATLDPKWNGRRGRRAGRRRGGRARNGRDQLEPETRESRTLTIDGYSYSGKYVLDPVAPNLMRVAVTISWDRYGVNAPKSPGSLEMVRLVADPMTGQGAGEGQP